MRNHLINELTAIAKKDKDVMLIAGDLGFGVLNEFMETLPDQFINAGIWQVWLPVLRWKERKYTCIP